MHASHSLKSPTCPCVSITTAGQHVLSYSAVYIIALLRTESRWHRLRKWMELAGSQFSVFRGEPSELLTPMLVSEKHFNSRSKSEVFHGRCRAQTEAPPVLFIRRIVCRTADPGRISRGRRFIDMIRCETELCRWIPNRMFQFSSDM